MPDRFAKKIQKGEVLRVNLVITNNLGDVLSRSFVWTFAQCTSSTLSLAITRNNRKNPIPKARSVFACVTAR